MAPNPVWHQLWDFSRPLGRRDRLRCPKCKAVGTWKPHGGWLDFADERKVRRWMCKWCGYYRGPEATQQVCYGGKCWVLSRDEWRSTTPTPRNVVRETLGNANPWFG